MHRLAYGDKAQLNVIPNDLNKEDIIQESSSPYASPIELVWKSQIVHRLPRIE